MKKVLTAIIVLSLIFTASCAGVDSGGKKQPDATPASARAPIEKALDVPWKCTTQDAQWQDRDALRLEPGVSGDADIKIDTARLRQEVEGFGGAFNEQGWAAMSVLAEDERDDVMKALFDPEQGAKFNICRVPIGASDYAISRYSLNETEGDTQMNDFSIERDKEYLLPYIMAAMSHKPGLKVWGSCWTPPTWMKTNGDYDGGSMKADANIYKAYALYLARFVEEYQAEGINLFAVAVQNEPEIERHYPTCLWEPEQYSTFIKDHFGPLFEQRGVNAEIMLGTLQDADFRRFPMLLSDPDVNKYVSIVGYQWSGLDSVALTRENYPDKRIYQTETECGNFYWKPGYDPDRPQNDWSYGIYTWNKVKEYFDEGVNAYMLWNIVLDEEGKSIDSNSPWPQNAAVTVDKNTKEVTYTPMFFAFKHFSYFVEPGARYVDFGFKHDAIAFLNPGGSLIILLQNQVMEEKTLIIEVDGAAMTITLPGKSWSTLAVPSH